MEDDEAPLGEPASSSHGPVDAARVLALLDEVNLRGARLAFQQGDEEALVEQVAARLDMWLLRFIKNLVQVAKAEAELEGRLDGSMTTPGAQAIRDAVEYQMKEGHRKKGHAEQEALKLVKAAPPKVGVQRRRTRKAMKFGSSAEEEEEIVMSVLVQELEVVGAPVLEKIQKVANKRRASDALKGKYRISSIRRYLAYWQKFRAWAQATSGQKMPRHHAHQLVDYLYAREEEGMGPSLPLAIWKGVSWFEKVAQIPEGERLSDDEFLGMVIKELLQKLEGKAPLVKRAPRMLSAFMGPMEDVVMDEDQHWAVRMAAWAKLVKVWASLRFDDLANLRMKEVNVYDGQLSGVMRRTKTTGAGKRVRELPIHVSADAWVKYPEWFTVGWDVVKHVRPRERDFVIPDGMTVCGLKVTEKLKYADAVAMSYDLMARLKCENGESLRMRGMLWVDGSRRAQTSTLGRTMQLWRGCRESMLNKWGSIRAMACSMRVQFWRSWRIGWWIIGVRTRKKPMQQLKAGNPGWKGHSLSSPSRLGKRWKVTALRWSLVISQLRMRMSWSPKERWPGWVRRERRATWWSGIGWERAPYIWQPRMGVGWPGRGSSRTTWSSIRSQLKTSSQADASCAGGHSGMVTLHPRRVELRKNLK